MGQMPIPELRAKEVSGFCRDRSLTLINTPLPFQEGNLIYYTSFSNTTSSIGSFFTTPNLVSIGKGRILPVF